MKKSYLNMSPDELENEYQTVFREYENIKAMKLSLDMSRGKPNGEQLDLTEDMLKIISSNSDCKTEAGVDCRNYGLLFGLPEARQLFASLLDIPADNIILGGNSSLNMMYDAVVRAMVYGVKGSPCPWGKLDKVKFLCPSPGYDRHFAICESLGIKMIPVRMTESGPDMDTVENLIENDETIKGIWCVPKYSNPQGITYSDETVRRFAALKPKAPDFKIFWDNAYAVHDVCDNGDELLNIFPLMMGTANENMLYYFFSTSKITYPGAGVAMMAMSNENMKFTQDIITVQTIGPDKMNQLRHIKFFKNAHGIREHMKLHAKILKPKFDVVINTLQNELAYTEIANWTSPKGGYFVSVDLFDGIATSTYQLAKDCGVVITKAGATFPCGKDPHDSNLRIAPSYPSLAELTQAISILTVCIKLAFLKKKLLK